MPGCDGGSSPPQPPVPALHRAGALLLVAAFYLFLVLGAVVAGMTVASVAAMAMRASGLAWVRAMALPAGLAVCVMFVLAFDGPRRDAVRWFWDRLR